MYATARCHRVSWSRTVIQSCSGQTWAPDLTGEAAQRGDRTTYVSGGGRMWGREAHSPGLLRSSLVHRKGLRYTECVAGVRPKWPCAGAVGLYTNVMQASLALCGLKR